MAGITPLPAMARVILSTAISQASGRLGDVEFRRHNGTTVVQTRQHRREPWSNRQLRHRGHFKSHTDYAFRVRGDPTLRKAYAAAGAKRRRPLNFWQAAVRDHATPPKIFGIVAREFDPARGGRIGVAAWDDFEVARVHVAVRTANGTLLRTGDAELQGSEWEYAIPAAVPGASPAASVVVTVFDRPGNFAIGTLNL